MCWVSIWSPTALFLWFEFTILFLSDLLPLLLSLSEPAGLDVREPIACMTKFEEGGVGRKGVDQ